MYTSTIFDNWKIQSSYKTVFYHTHMHASCFQTCRLTHFVLFLYFFQFLILRGGNQNQGFKLSMCCPTELHLQSHILSPFFFSVVIHFQGTEDLTQGLVHAWQVLYHWALYSHLSVTCFIQWNALESHLCCCRCQ